MAKKKKGGMIPGGMDSVLKKTVRDSTAKAPASGAEKTLTKATKPAKPKRQKLKDMGALQRMDEADRRSRIADRKANRHYRAMENIDANSADAQGGLKRTGGDQKVPPRNAPFYRAKGIGKEHNLTAAEAYGQSEEKARKAEARRNRLKEISKTGEMPKKSKKNKKGKK